MILKKARDERTAAASNFSAKTELVNVPFRHYFGHFLKSPTGGPRIFLRSGGGKVDRVRDTRPLKIRFVFLQPIDHTHRVQSTEAIVTRITRLTETSLIVHWFTESHGLVKTVAKGARRAKSPFTGQLDLFFGGEISFTHARQGDLHRLREVAIRQWREGLRRDYTTTLLAAYCCQLLEMAVEPEHPDPQLHDLLKRALDHLDTSAPSLRALRHFETELVRMLGIAHHRQSADASLADTLGKLPASRDDLIERLSPPRDFSSSGGGNER